MPAKDKLIGPLVVAVCAGGAISALAATSALAVTPPRAELRDQGCQRAVDPPGRAVTITAVMRPVSGTERMALKFELERRPPHGGMFTVLPGHNLGDWVHPADSTLGQLPGDEWMLRHNVVNLAGPAYYRFRVSFRWTGASGRVLAQRSRLSPVCYQPEPRADLSARSLAVTSLSPQQDRYVALIHNGGATAAGPFTVELNVPSASSQTADVGSLAPGANVRATFIGRVCSAGSSVTAIADPNRQVDDANRKNNTLTVVCPSSSTS
jgi:CARDB